MRKKLYGKLDRRGIIPNRLSIEERPSNVETRSRISDWEADTVIGKNHRQAIVSLVERKTAQAVSQAMVKLLKPYLSKVHTVTSNNGREFARHEEIATALQADVYFAHPYTSWERGTNVSTNVLIPA